MLLFDKITCVKRKPVLPVLVQNPIRTKLFENSKVDKSRKLQFGMIKFKKVWPFVIILNRSNLHHLCLCHCVNVQSPKINETLPDNLSTLGIQSRKHECDVDKSG